jgi:hypothetical protein
VKFYAPLLEGVTMKRMSKAAGLACLLAMTGAALAHHSFSMFDLTRETTLSGTVKAVEWTNPHVWLFVVREGVAEEAATYAFETASPGELMRFYGWSKSTLNVGDKVLVRYAPLRSGRPGGSVKSITLGNGKVLQTPQAKIPVGPPGGSDAQP